MNELQAPNCILLLIFTSCDCTFLQSSSDAQVRHRVYALCNCNYYAVYCMAPAGIYYEYYEHYESSLQSAAPSCAQYCICPLKCPCTPLILPFALLQMFTNWQTGHHLCFVMYCTGVAPCPVAWTLRFATMLLQHMQENEGACVLWYMTQKALPFFGSLGLHASSPGQGNINKVSYNHFVFLNSQCQR